MTRINILAPVTGRVVALTNVSDPVFAGLMMGDGLAIEPSAGVAVAPISGNVVIFHGAGHAYAVQDPDSGVAVLVHLGLDTVTLHGTAFTRLAEVGDVVTAGQEIARIDLAIVAAAGLSAISPVVLPQLDARARVQKTEAVAVEAGRDTLLVVDV